MAPMIKLGGLNFALRRTTGVPLAASLTGVPVANMKRSLDSYYSYRNLMKASRGLSRNVPETFHSGKFRTSGIGLRLQTDSGIPMSRQPRSSYTRSNTVGNAVNNNVKQETKKQINKWVPTIVGAGVLGGGIVAYSDSRKNGRGNNELYRP
jgi:hypothetical protein